MPTSKNWVPSTIAEAVDNIVAGADEEERKYIKESTPESNHFFGGMAMRNGWKLWEKETPLKRDAVETYKIAHADDISSLILDWAWAKVRGEEFDAASACERFHTHWREQSGMSSLQAGGYHDTGVPMTEEEQTQFYAACRRG